LIGAGAKLAQSDSPRLSENDVLRQLRPCFPDQCPACGPTEPPGIANARHGLAVGINLDLRRALLRPSPQELREFSCPFAIIEITLSMQIGHSDNWLI